MYVCVCGNTYQARPIFRVKAQPEVFTLERRKIVLLFSLCVCVLGALQSSLWLKVLPRYNKIPIYGYGSLRYVYGTAPGAPTHVQHHVNLTQ